VTPNRLITLAIHTYEKAQPIKTLLEQEGIYVELNNVNLASPTVSAGVRIRIKESDLPLALRIVENIEIFDVAKDSGEGKDGVMLVPTDFSSYSDNAVRLAFHIASRLGYNIVMLYAYMAPSNPPAIQLTDSYDYEIADMVAMRKLKREAKKQMDDYALKVKGWMKKGEIPAVKFSTQIEEGIPEEVILEYTRKSKPQMVVMGTRGADKKEAELIGSVTAEVLDSCRIPAFTVPENVDINRLIKLKSVAFICNFDQEDMIALDTLYRLFPDQALEVVLIHLPGKNDKEDARLGKAQFNLLQYCREHFPRCSFDLRVLRLQALIDDFRDIMQESTINMICVPNKKRNVFARVFNPSIAHKILFKADVPMMVIPV
jgi:nucleotide-binding universal stress UspA family protein